MSQMSVYARTNYFRTRDLGGLLAILKPYDVVVDQVEKDGVTFVAITGNDGDGDFPNRMRVSDEMSEFADQLAESYRFDKIDVNEMDSGDLFDSVQKMCSLHGKHASDEDIQTLVTLVKADEPDDIEIDFGLEVSHFLADGEVMVMYAVGMEGRRLPHSVFGSCRAFTNKGLECEIDLYDIEKKVEDRLCITPRRVGIEP